MGWPKTNRFLLAKNIFKTLAHSDIEGLNQFSASIYRHLKNELKKLDNYVKKEIPKILEELHDEFYDHMSDDYWKYEETFPLSFGYLLIVRYYSLLEYHLFSICQNIQRELTDKLEPFLKKQKKGTKIEHYVKYLKDVAEINLNLDDENWTYILNILNPVRNCITHDDGNIGTNSKKEDKLREIVSNNALLLSLTSHDKIQIKKEFIFKSSKMIEAFFEHLFSAWHIWAEIKGK